jgi:hypothetical protein
MAPQIDQTDGTSIAQGPDGNAINPDNGAPVDSGLNQASPKKTGRAFEQDLAHQFYDERAQAQRQYEDSQTMYSESAKQAREVLQKATDRLTAMQHGPSQQELALRYGAAALTGGPDATRGIAASQAELAKGLAERRTESEGALDKLTGFGTQSANLGMSSAKLMEQQALSRMNNLSMREVAAGRAATTGVPWYVEQFGGGFQMAPGAENVLAQIDYAKQYWKVQKATLPDGSTTYTYNGQLLGQTPGSGAPGAIGAAGRPQVSGAGLPAATAAATVAPSVSWNDGGMQGAIAAVNQPGAQVRYEPAGPAGSVKLIVNGAPVAFGPQSEIDAAIRAGTQTAASAPVAGKPEPTQPGAEQKYPGGTAYKSAWTPPAVYTQYTPALAAKQYAPIYEHIAEEAVKDIRPVSLPQQQGHFGEAAGSKNAYDEDKKYAEATDKAVAADSMGAGNKLLIAQHMLDDINSGKMHPGALGQALLPIRSQLATLGVLPPDAAASDEAFQKWARQLSSADLKNLFGGRVTNMELEQQIKSNPNGAMSPEGMKALLKLEIEKDTLNLHRAAMWNLYRTDYHGAARSFDSWYNKYWNPYDVSKTRMAITAMNDLKKQQAAYAQSVAAPPSTAAQTSRTPVTSTIRSIPSAYQSRIDAIRARLTPTPAPAAQPQVAPNGNP